MDSIVVGIAAIGTAGEVGCNTPAPPTGIVFHRDTLQRSDGHGDNWCITWAANGSQVTSMDDGDWLKGDSRFESQGFSASSGTLQWGERPPRLGVCGQQQAPVGQAT